MRRRLRFLATCFACIACSGSFAQAPSGVAHAQAGPWDGALKTFEEEDLRRSPDSGGVVFVGSSSIRLWTGLETQWRDLPVIKRGFGGSRLSDCVQYLDKLVIRHHPRLVLVYAGENDLAEGRSPSDVLAQFTALVRGIRKELPQTRVAFISIKPSPARESLIPEVRETNRLVEQYVAATPSLEYIDVYSPMLDELGHPRQELFRSDALHLNDSGYALWKSVITPHLR
jgi:lysophospholipase L1-like esterase